MPSRLSERASNQRAMAGVRKDQCEIVMAGAEAIDPLKGKLPRTLPNSVSSCVLAFLLVNRDSEDAQVGDESCLGEHQPLVKALSLRGPNPEPLEGSVASNQVGRLDLWASWNAVALLQNSPEPYKLV